MSFTPDPDYNLIEPLKRQAPAKRGNQCGLCDMKFDYYQSYGYYCGRGDCPMGFGARFSVGTSGRSSGSVSAPIGEADG